MNTIEFCDDFGLTVSVQVMAVAHGSVVSEVVLAAAGQAEPLKGGVHQWGALVDRDAAYSSENTLIGVHPATSKMDKLAAKCGRLDTLMVAPLTREPTPAEALGLPAQVPFGKSGRKVAVTPAVAEQICLLLSVGFSRRQVAAHVGISPTAITNAVQRDPELAAEFRRAEELSDIQPQVTLAAEVLKNWKAAAWYLEFRAKHPRPLSPEEKEERRQAQLAEESAQPKRRKKVRGK